MTASSTSRPSRTVALVLVGLAVAGLAYLRYGRSETVVSVPPSAQAGDLILEPCTYEAEGGTLAADCGAIVLPENREDPGSRLIAIPITRIHATGEPTARPLFRLEGGPGKTNMDFATASRFAATREVVLVGYRGVDGTVRLDCPEVVAALERNGSFFSQRSLEARTQATSDCAERLQSEGIDLRGYSLPQRVDDFEAARRALGYGQVDVVSESAGTRLAMIWSWRHPESIHRSVMIGANPPGHYLWDPAATDRLIARYSRLCAADDACSARTNDLAGLIERTAADIPDRWFGLPIDEDNVRMASFYGLMESTTAAAPLAGPMTIESWLQAANGDASGFWFQSFAGDLLFPNPWVWGDINAAARADVHDVELHFATSGSHRDGSVLGDAGNHFVWGSGRMIDAWPADGTEDEYQTVQTSEVETLVVGGTLDLTTPPQVATEELLPHLPNGHQVVLRELGHSTDFWGYQPEASTHLLTTFYDRGEVDDSRYDEAVVDFTPQVTQTAIAKGLLATMAGLALLTLVSLAWMAGRVRRRGGFGPVGGALLRTVYPVVLGLGGWFLGVLVVQVALPDVPLTDVRLGVLGVVTPIGLGIYLASVRSAWSSGTKFGMLAGAVAGALVGGWLGFSASGGLAALLTTIVGATAGSNLGVICVDRARWARPPHSAATPPVAALSDAEATRAPAAV